MGIKALCAAAAVVAGVGSAEAATVDHVKLTLTAEYICEAGECDEPAPSVAKFMGIPVGQSVYGDLHIGDKDADLFQRIVFFSKGTVNNLGYFRDDYSDGRYSERSSIEGLYAYLINWNGLVGSLWYRDDDYPWSLDVSGTIELAPVPLPATAALLPMGLGALALMRRRRRS
ncbi:hypothetical protein [Paracoccus sp. SY]|uniref:hypothetical protein n=1 Tax=Paracoccus sp. SY TaxID=1330255 RepID=UPI000CD1D4FE|nr:hypothetical protein [Paracoccus sp. SY]